MGPRIAAGEIKIDYLSNLRGILMQAAELWGAINLKRQPGISVEYRLRIRGYAEAYGIEFKDENDAAPGRPLSLSELARLPEFRREARERHRIEIALFRAKRRLPWIMYVVFAGAMAAVAWAIELVQDALDWVEIERLFTLSALKVLLTIAGLYFLLGVAFGFASPVGFGGYLFGRGMFALHWGRQHPDTVWFYTRIAAGSAFLIWAVVLGVKFLEWLETRNYVPAPRAVSVPAPVRRYEIQNFRERSAFGDANLAKRQQVARALAGNRGGFAEQFEE